jgi:hypothetical protein
MPKPRRRSPGPPPDQLPLPTPDPEEAARLTADLFDRLTRDRQPARPTPWLLPLPEPVQRRRPPPRDW